MKTIIILLISLIISTMSVSALYNPMHSPENMKVDNDVKHIPQLVPFAPRAYMTESSMTITLTQTRLGKLPNAINLAMILGYFDGYIASTGFQGMLTINIADNDGQVFATTSACAGSGLDAVTYLKRVYPVDKVPTYIYYDWLAAP
jgi:hypothetical protein